MRLASRPGREIGFGLPNCSFKPVKEFFHFFVDLPERSLWCKHFLGALHIWPLFEGYPTFKEQLFHAVLGEIQVKLKPHHSVSIYEGLVQACFTFCDPNRFVG